MKKLNVLFDMSLDRPTLGGVIILRKESEILAKVMNISKINLIIKKHKYNKKNFAKYFKEVFLGSKYKFKIYYNIDRPDINWPIIEKSNNKKFSYTSFLGITKLVNKFKLKPILEWNKKTLKIAKKTRKKLPKNLIAVHLKNISPYKEEKSNVNGKIWDNFFSSYLSNKKVGFLLIGNDKIPNNINLSKNIFSAKNLKIPLNIQLCLVSLCNGFLGMASGPSVAANFSNIPYYIFKHPDHDKNEIKKEIGRNNRLPFAKKDQIIKTKMPSVALLKKITSTYYERI